MSDSFAAWSERHRTLFGLNSEWDVKGVALWEKPLSIYTLAELDEATDWIAGLGTPLTGLPEHLAMIHARVRNRRHEAFILAEMNRYRAQHELGVKSTEEIAKRSFAREHAKRVKK